MTLFSSQKTFTSQFDIDNLSQDGFGKTWYEDDVLWNADKTSNSIRAISNEVALAGAFGEDSILYRASRDVIVGIIPKISGHHANDWNYEIILDYNGAQLIREFKEVPIDEKIDIIIFAEKDDFSISLGKVLLIKLSDSIVKYYYTYIENDDLLRYWGKAIIELQKNNNTFHFKEEDIVNAFRVSLLLQTPNTTGLTELDLQNYRNQIFKIISIGIRDSLKFNREQWDPTLNSKAYLFSQPQNIILNRCDDVIGKLNSIKSSVNFLKQFPSDLQIESPLADTIVQFIDFLIDNLNAIKFFLEKDNIVDAHAFAFYCGEWNGLVEIIAGILDLLFLLADIKYSAENDSALYLKYLEIREEVEELLNKILSAYIQDKNFLSKKIEEFFINYIKERYLDESLTSYQIAHNAGEDLIFAIDFVSAFVGLVLVIEKLVAVLSKFNKWIDDVLYWIEDVSKRKGSGARAIENIKKGLFLVSYEESRLGKMVLEFRRDSRRLGIDPFYRGNILVVEYIDDAGRLDTLIFSTLIKVDYKFLYGKHNPHTERLLIDWIKQENIPIENIKMIYTELEPCSLSPHFCKDLLKENFPEIRIEYSYKYPGTYDTHELERRRAIDDRESNLKRLLK